MMQEIFIQENAGRLACAFSWMLIHSLWQGLLLYAFASAIQQHLSKASAALRYNLVLLLFAFFLAACACTFSYEWGAFTARNAAPLLTGSAGPSALQITALQRALAAAVAWYSANAAYTTILWLLVFSYRLLGLIHGMLYLRWAKIRDTSDPGPLWQEKVSELARLLQIKPAVRLLASKLVNTPLVIGQLRPLILIPAALMTGLPPGQLEAIILHELAHIRRRDYLVNFLQTFAEAFFCFNPGLLWISALLREERENCCDDIVLAHTGQREELADALISCKEHALFCERYMVAFAGQKNVLLRRIKRILGHNDKSLGAGDKSLFILAVATLCLLFTSVTIANVATMPRPKESPVKREPIHALIQPTPIAPVSPKKQSQAAPYKSLTPAANVVRRPVISAAPATVTADTATNAAPLSDQERVARDRANMLRDRRLADSLKNR